jgi:predicted MFS family arabinose efflux permease/quinol monooxygenase YgiN
MGTSPTEPAPVTSLAKRSGHSPWGAFQHRTFTVIWTATVVSNIGTWMYNAASSWLMTGLNVDTLMVSLVQVASTFPMFLFALPAGALADIVDKRRFLMIGESSITFFSALFTILVWLHRVTPGNLLLFAFLIGATSALVAPAWQAVVPQLVPREDLPGAVGANSVGVNISRAIGPALGGVITAALGIAAPFLVNTLSNLGVIGSLKWWRPPTTINRTLPAERFASAIRTGIRHARYNPHLRSTLLRATGFFLFSSAYWALLPIIARNRVAGGPALYGILLGAIGLGAVGGAFVRPVLRTRLGPDGLVVAGTVGTALALFLFGVARAPMVAVAASLLAGMSWIIALSTLNVSAQVALPEWVRARGLAMFLTVFAGTMALGSLVWGEVASLWGLPMSHYLAASGALLTIPLTWRWKLQTGAKVDLSPSMHWPAPIVTEEVAGNEGPVLVTVDYRIDPKRREAFLKALGSLAHERRRDGAYAWAVFEDVAKPGRFVETFLVESWLEHLLQHERVTRADRKLEEKVHSFLHEPPRVTHLITAEPNRERAPKAMSPP